jgi:hypothetical protein
MQRKLHLGRNDNEACGADGVHICDNQVRYEEPPHDGHQTIAHHEPASRRGNMQISGEMDWLLLGKKACQAVCKV